MATKKGVIITITLLAISLCFQGAFAQEQIFSETFDQSSLPDGWVINDLIEGGGGEWAVSQDAPDGVTYTTISPPFMFADSRSAGTEFKVELISPVIDCTGYPTVTVNFDHNILFDADLSISAWVGVPQAAADDDDDDDYVDTFTWSVVNLFSETADEGPAAFDISAIAGSQSEVRIKWVYTTGDAANDGYWAVDNVTLTDEGLPIDDDDAAGDDDDVDVGGGGDEEEDEDECGCWLTKRDDK